jgi:hypothetical protein
MVKVYVAGAYSANNVLDVLVNIGHGEELATQCFLSGYAPFCPWFDKEFIIRHPEKEYTVDMFYEYSIAWLEVSDCILLVPGWEFSKGTLKEIEIAKKLNMPIFKDIESMINYYEG